MFHLLSFHYVLISAGGTGIPGTMHPVSDLRQNARHEHYLAVLRNVDVPTTEHGIVSCVGEGALSKLQRGADGQEVVQIEALLAIHHVRPVISSVFYYRRTGAVVYLEALHAIVIDPGMRDATALHPLPYLARVHA